MYDGFSTPTDDPDPMSSSAHPHGLGLVIDFVNTLDIDAGEESLAGPQQLSSWLSERGLLASGTQLTPAQLAEALRLREALRGVMEAHNGASRDHAGEAELDAVAARGELGVRFGDGGAVEIAPRAGGFAGALAALLAPVARGAADGTWARAKACRAEDCRWAFYDRSRNRSGTWCDMAVCGNRTKVRAYRERAPSRPDAA
jgi:predicted RNA-binding Zn ribbon-like protein